MPSFAWPRESPRARNPRNSCSTITRFTAVSTQRFAASTPAIPCSNPRNFLRMLRFELQAINRSDHSQQSAPPDRCMQREKHDGVRWRMPQLVHTGAENQHAIHQQRNPNEKPNGNHPRDLRLPKVDIQDEKYNDHHASPKVRLLINGHIADRRHFRSTVCQTMQFAVRLWFRRQTYDHR